MGFIATCFTFGVQVHVRHMSCIVDVVKAVNAWVGSAFDNVLLRDESHESHLFIFGIRLEICRDRRDRRSCKIFPSCVKFWGNNANSLGNYRVIYALNE